MKLLFIYLIIMGLISFIDRAKIKNCNDFLLAGRCQNTPHIFMSLMATILGASATIGIAAKVTTFGFAAFWWLGVGALGLLLQAAFLCRPIHELQVMTLPELAGKTIGQTGRRLVAAIIAISWIGIIAAQFSAITGLISLLLVPSGIYTMIITSLCIIGYTLLGGQLSVVRTDAMQFVILTMAFAATAVFVFGGFATPDPLDKSQLALGPAPDFSLLNNNFTLADLAKMAITVGGAYFLGPDVISRNFIAKDFHSARKAALAGSFAVIVFSIIIVLLAMWVNRTIPTAGTVNGANPLFILITDILPKPLAALLALGLLSALFSSADTCLINSAAIIGHDIFHSSRLAVLRLFVAINGIIALLLAVSGHDIISLLIMAYSVYTPGIVAPLAIAIITHKWAEINKPLWYGGVIIGGLCGLIPVFLTTFFNIGTPDYWPIIGFVLSLILALASLRKRPV